MKLKLELEKITSGPSLAARPKKSKGSTYVEVGYDERNGANGKIGGTKSC
jgi:hypothetical protein